MNKFDDPKYNVYSSNYGIETLNDDIFKKGRTETITTGDGAYEKMYFDKRTKTYKPLPLPGVTIYSDGASDRNPNSAASIKENYKNIILELRNQGYNNWADAVEYINQHGGGIGNAIAWYQGSVARHNDLLKAQQHANTVSEKAPYKPLAKAIGLGLLGTGIGGALMTGGGLATGGSAISGISAGEGAGGGTVSLFGSNALPGYGMGSAGQAVLIPRTTLDIENLLLPLGITTLTANGYFNAANSAKNKRRYKQQTTNNDIEDRLSQIEQQLQNNNNEPWWWKNRGKIGFGLGAATTWWLTDKSHQQETDSIEQKQQEEIIDTDLEGINDLTFSRTVKDTIDSVKSSIDTLLTTGKKSNSSNNYNSNNKKLNKSSNSKVNNKSNIFFAPGDTLSNGW